MIDFIDIQTDEDRYTTEDGLDVARKVSLAYSDSDPKRANLLGNLPHQTSFLRSDLVAFAYDVIDRFAEDQSLAAKAKRACDKAEAIYTLKQAAKAVIDNWESGDLAEAVNGLRWALEDEDEASKHDTMDDVILDRPAKERS